MLLCTATQVTSYHRSMNFYHQGQFHDVPSFYTGFVPAPIWFALVIDKSCVYWGPKCKGKAVCKLYYLEGLRLSFVGACVLLALGYIITFGLTASWVWFKEGKENPSKYEVLNEPEKDGK